ncbi:MAG: NAD+ synthase [Candidatus Thermoplasmatota archaeon]
MLNINEEEALDIILNFIRDYREKSEREKIVIGLSGGVDSSLVAKLATMAIGKENVHSIFLPDVSTPLEDFEHSRVMAKSLGISYKVIDLSPMIHSITNACGEMDEITLGNIKARLRMIFLYQFANSKNALVCGTSNKTELMIGYFTKYGDGASDILPIGDLYKTQVYQLARYVGIPEEILKKPPTAGLWKGQTDEKELGISYEKLDKILYGLERQKSFEEISKIAEVSIEEVKRIYGMVKKTEHKRKFPVIPKISFRTIGIDWRVPL